jgi:DNA polymerase III delta prime subunit
MRLNRGQQLGTSCGMILSGVPGVGKTTAIRAFGRTVERAYRARNPQMTDAVPVVYITMPTAQHPKALPAELPYFLGAPHAVRAAETALTHQACQLMTDLRTSLVIVDEVHEIDRSRASHDQQSDQLKYFMDHVSATFVLAGINVENCGFFTGHRGHQLARRFTPLKASPSNYSTIPQRQDWAMLIEGFERALRLHAHKPDSLLPLADYLYGRTGGYIVSLSHLIREAAIKAILTGTERIDEELLDSVELDHAATEEAAAQQQALRKTRKRASDEPRPAAAQTDPGRAPPPPWRAIRFLPGQGRPGQRDRPTHVRRPARPPPVAGTGQRTGPGGHGAHLERRGVRQAAVLHGSCG